MKVKGITAAFAALLLTVGASPAAASVTIGQLAPGATTACDEGYDWMSFFGGVPANGTITSWSHVAAAGAGQRMTMKIWRFEDAGHSGIFVNAVGHDGPRTLAEGTLNTFPASIPVKRGDMLGLHTDTGGVGCVFAVPGGVVYRAFMNAADREDAKFPSAAGGCLCDPILYDSRLNLTATFEASNAVSFDRISHNLKRGTATINLHVPNPGELTASGRGLGGTDAGKAIRESVDEGPAAIAIKAKGRKKRKLNAAGEVKLNVAVTFTPAYGDPAGQPVSVKLKKKL